MSVKCMATQVELDCKLHWNSPLDRYAFDSYLRKFYKVCRSLSAPYARKTATPTPVSLERKRGRYEDLSAKQHFAKDAALDALALVRAQTVALFSQPSMGDNLRFELRHQAIVDRFGRYPHLNAILGRTSSAEELAFMAEPGSSF